MVHSHLKFIRLELVHKLNSPHNYENGTQPILELFGPRKSTTHYLVNSLGDSSRLINHKCKWTLRVGRGRDTI